MITQLPGHAGAIWECANKPSGLVIDLGGGDRPLPQTSVVVDLRKPDCGAEWIQADLCDWDWSKHFPDKHFDWAWCNHTLEDIRDPIGLLRAIVRISRQAVIGTPHWTYECGIRAERDDWEAISGWPHHRWLVGINARTGAYEFQAKQCWFVKSDYQESQPNLNIEWDGGEFQFAEISNEYPGQMKRSELIRWLEDRWLR